MTNTETELKPCPFCGAPATIEEDWGYVTCSVDSCSAYGPTSVGTGVEEWNTRPAEAALQARIEELEAERRWVPVEEALPKDDEHVLVWDGWDYGVGRYSPYSGMWWDVSGIDQLKNIKCWRPIGAPPTEQA